jgi:hypothetical protein
MPSLLDSVASDFAQDAPSTAFFRTLSIMLLQLVE